MEVKKQDIRELSIDEISSFLDTISEKRFRSSQIFEWIWKKNVHTFDQMTNLSVKLREHLHDHFYIKNLSIDDEQISTDKTVKCTFFAGENNRVEGVLIPTTNRMTACISSQVGCSLSCKFCATGRLKMMRNLSSGEIVDQVVYLKNKAESLYQKTLTNIVYMGMGEPLLNYKNMMRSVGLISSPEGLGISPKRITVSTAGIAKMIKKLGDDEIKFNLALSLHAANDFKRSQIMEINDSNNLESLSEALVYFYEKTGTRVTFEYIIFKDFNDSLQDAQELVKFSRCIPCKINIIEYNAIDESSFHKADAQKVNDFANYLDSKGLIVNIRRSRGKDIDAACGQLANKNSKKIKTDG